MNTNLYIIRHGEAVANINGTMGGMRSCEGLTPRGHRQVRHLAQRLSGGEISADVLYASTIRRAQETAEPVAEALGLPITWDDELHEIRPGEEIDGLSSREVFERYGWVPFDQPYTPFGPGAESFAVFINRACTAIDRLVRRHEGRNIVVVAHGGIIEASFYLMLGLGPYTMQHTSFWTHHTGITHWRRQPHWDPSVDHPRWFLVRYNDDRHLADFDEKEP